MISLTADEVYKRFGVKIAIENFPSVLTEDEEKNAKTVINYMEVGNDSFSRILPAKHYTDMDILVQVAYSPKKNTGGDSVKEFCQPGNKFEARSTFPDAHSAEGYAESHSHVMSSLKDLHIKSFQVVNVKGKLPSHW